MASISAGTLAAAPERRQVRVNGAAAAVNGLGEWLAILWLTPAMDRLFTGSAGERRRFLDRLAEALDAAEVVEDQRCGDAALTRDCGAADTLDAALASDLQTGLDELLATLVARVDGTCHISYLV